MLNLKCLSPWGLVPRGREIQVMSIVIQLTPLLGPLQFMTIIESTYIG